MDKPLGLPACSRLKSRKQIDRLFAGGKSFAMFPLRVTYLFSPTPTGSLQVGVTVSKRYFKKAVDRNRIKRLLREAYRLQKADFETQLIASEQQGDVFFLYTGKSMPAFKEIFTAVAKCLQKLSVIASSVNPV